MHNFLNLFTKYRDLEKKNADLIVELDCAKMELNVIRNDLLAARNQVPRIMQSLVRELGLAEEAIKKYIEYAYEKDE